MTDQLKSTPLKETHIALGAKMVPFAGFEMPIQYTSLVEEHLAVRNSVGVFDVSHMGEFMIEGPEALDFIQHVISNDASKLVPGQAQYACLPNGKGGIVDDLIIYKMDDTDEKFMMVVNASNIEKDFRWLLSNNRFAARITDISDEIGLLAVQGPKAKDFLQGLTHTNLDEVGFYRFTIGNIGDIEDVIISGTGYTGSGGFELYVKSGQLVKLWNILFDRKSDITIAPVGLGARDTLRLEMGYCLYGNDIDDTTSPLEAGLGWITKLKKENFIDKEFLVEQKAKGIGKKLVGFKVNDRRVPRKDYVIEDLNGLPIGKVTSGTQSPSLGIPIGMGYVQIAYSKPEIEIRINTGRKSINAIISSTPFIKNS
ncbi:MAG: glycine cleavage system aminomethyltransferase GcvT [Bacteroidia bacterium]|nr:glycine cleavage system aminomethyltransferase GcvT [Bacteroidia bacterium]